MYSVSYFILPLLPDSATVVKYSQFPEIVAGRVGIRQSSSRFDMAPSQQQKQLLLLLLLLSRKPVVNQLANLKSNSSGHAMRCGAVLCGATENMRK